MCTNKTKLQHRAVETQTKYRSPSLFYLRVHSRCRGFCFSLDHTQTHATVGRTPLDEGSARRRDLYLTKQTLTRYKKILCPRWDSNPRSQQALGRRSRGHRDRRRRNISVRIILHFAHFFRLQATLFMFNLQRNICTYVDIFF
jgi:hypothetical protein